MTANSAKERPPSRSDAAARICTIPSAIVARRDFFCFISTATLKFRVFPMFSAERFAILGTNHLRCGSPPFGGGRADGPNRDAQEIHGRLGC
jgi:hypothetical protein